MARSNRFTHRPNIRSQSLPKNSKAAWQSGGVHIQPTVLACPLPPVPLLPNPPPHAGAAGRVAHTILQVAEGQCIGGQRAVGRAGAGDGTPLQINGVGGDVITTVTSKQTRLLVHALVAATSLGR